MSYPTLRQYANGYVRWIDALWLMAGMIYIFAGISVVPFHGDESTTIWMSRDYGYVLLDADLDRVRYNNPPINATEQHMRLITGSLTKILIGLFWHIDGFTTAEINEQWDWGADWHYNWNNGHAPDECLLMLGRLPSTIMLAVGLLVYWFIGKLVGGREVAYLASLYYVLNPALLLNGRRAMFEGGLILFSLLVVLAAIWVLRHRNWRSALLLGVCSGLAVAAKHTGAFTVSAVFLAGILYAFRATQVRVILPRLLTAGVVAFGLFYAMHPNWWGDPFRRADQMLEARTGILEGQVAAFGGYENRLDQLVGFGRQVFVGHPQYYEVPVWSEYIADEIERYEASLLHGISIGGSIPGAIILVGLAALGSVTLLRSAQVADHVRYVVISWAGITLMTAMILTPLEWQRYYLMTYPAIGLLGALGVQALIKWVSVRRDAQPHTPALMDSQH